VAANAVGVVPPLTRRKHKCGSNCLQSRKRWLRQYTYIGRAGPFAAKAERRPAAPMFGYDPNLGRSGFSREEAGTFDTSLSPVIPPSRLKRSAARPVPHLCLLRDSAASGRTGISHRTPTMPGLRGVTSSRVGEGFNAAGTGSKSSPRWCESLYCGRPGCRGCR
jgi:hypothetical protein